MTFKTKEQAEGAKEALIALIQDKELLDCDLSAEIEELPDSEDGAKNYKPSGVITITATLFKKEDKK